LSNVLVFPSYREGFPNVPLQAGAMQKALLLSNINGRNEIVQHGVNGLLVPAKNKNELIEGMEQLLTNKEYASELALAAHLSITKRYEQSVVWQALLDEYNSALAR